MDYADEFADRYLENPDDFVQFLSNSDFTVQGSYGETWRFIFDGTNSLQSASSFSGVFYTLNHTAIPDIINNPTIIDTEAVKLDSALSPPHFSV